MLKFLLVVLFALCCGAFNLVPSSVQLSSPSAYKIPNRREVRAPKEKCMKVSCDKSCGKYDETDALVWEACKFNQECVAYDPLQEKSDGTCVKDYSVKKDGSCGAKDKATTNPEFVCKKDLYCNSSSLTCIPRSKDGEDCMIHPCKKGLYCHYAEDYKSATCKKLIKKDQACDEKQAGPCKEELRCATDEKKCLPRRKDDESCNSTQRKICWPSHSCVDNKCMKPRQKKDGESCKYSFECDIGSTCFEEKCKAWIYTGGVGDECDPNGFGYLECKTGLVCSEYWNCTDDKKAENVKNECKFEGGVCGSTGTCACNLKEGKGLCYKLAVSKKADYNKIKSIYKCGDKAKTQEAYEKCFRSLTVFGRKRYP